MGKNNKFFNKGVTNNHSFFYFKKYLYIKNKNGF